MAAISYDGQSFLIDGKRIWLTCGAIHYPRTPREQWAARIRAAKEAGLNCIETYVFWNIHETAPGVFDWEGDKDLRHFVELVADEGMFCIVRPGPFVCSEWDNGALPAWLHTLDTEGAGPIRLRQSHPAFLQACARWFGAVMGQIRDLQITVPIEGRKPKQRPAQNEPGAAAGGFAGSGRGPIIAMQGENEWFCNNPDENEAYLVQLLRYLRENGCEVPLINCNCLWQRTDGTIDMWNGSAHLPANMRQLAVVQPDAPRVVSEYWPGWFDQWGGGHADTVSPGKHLYRLAGMLAVGAQYNVYMFHGGTNFGFTGGRTVDSNFCFMTTSYDYDAPLLEAGGRGEKYDMTKRASVFSSQFGSLLANLDPTDHHAAIALNETDHSLSVLHQRGSQGDVIFLLRSEKSKERETSLLLPNGLTLPVDMGKDRAAWIVLNANLNGIAKLDYTNLRPWAFVGRKLLVLFGPAGSQGMVSINDTPFSVTVPTGKEPMIEAHDDLQVVVLSTEQVDAAYLCKDGLAVGAGGLNAEGEPVHRPGWATCYRVNVDGQVRKQKLTPVRKPRTPKLDDWEHAPLTAFVDGSADAYQKIDGPVSLDKLGINFGYGWYHLSMGKGTEGLAWSPQSTDRLHVYRDGVFDQILGVGPSATEGPTELALKGEVVVLADNLGRFNYGLRVGEQKGLLHPFYSVKPLKTPKATITPQRGPDAFALSGYVMNQRKGERLNASAISWELKPASRKPVILELRDFPADGVLLVNDEPVALYSKGGSAGYLCVVLDPADDGPFTGGKNTLTLSLHRPLKDDVKPNDYLTLHQVTGLASARAQWSYARWSRPTPADFAAPPKSPTKQPAWFRCHFDVSNTDVPLWLEPAGMKKGQIFLNGHDVGRYWMSDLSGKSVPPQSHYYLPEAWLRTDEPNELLLFDEHGALPGKCKLHYNAMGPYNT